MLWAQRQAFELAPPVSFAHLPNHSDLRICHRADRLVCLPHPFLAAQVPSSMPSMIRMRAARCSLGSGVSSLHQSDHVHTCTKHQSAKPTVHRSVRRLSLRLSCQGRGLLPCVHALSTQCKFNTRTDVYASLLTLKRPRTALPGVTRLIAPNLSCIARNATDAALLRAHPMHACSGRMGTRRTEIGPSLPRRAAPPLR